MEVRLLAALPVFAGHDTPDHFWVVIERFDGTGTHGYVVTWVYQLAVITGEFGSAYHTSDAADAMTKLYTMAGIRDFPWESLPR